MSQTSFQHLDCRQEPGALVVTLKDSHVSGDELAEAIRKELLNASEEFEVSKWIVDFSRVQFFTSSGIRPLLTLHRKLQSSGARLVLCNLREDIAEVFHATRLLATAGAPPGPFEAAPDLENALRRLRRHTCKLEDGILILTMGEKELRGEELADDLAHELLNSWHANPVTNVLIDFKDVEIVTTPCIRSLLQLRNQVKEKGGQVAVCNLTPQVAEIFSVTRLVPPSPGTPAVFGCYGDVATAKKALAKN